MSKFKVGDIVTPVRVDGDIYSDSMKKMIGKPLAIINAAPYGDSTPLVCTRGPQGNTNIWIADDLRLFYETQGEPDPAAVSEGPERTKFQIASEQYKPGDKIMILSADPMYPAYKRKMVGTVQTVLVISSVTPQPIHAEINGELSSWGWMPHEVRLATQEEIAADGVVPKQNPLRRGDLVMYKGEICVVFSEGADRAGDYMVASLTGDPDSNWPKIDELIRVGSIIKKVKRLEAQREKWK